MVNELAELNEPSPEVDQITDVLFMVVPESVCDSPWQIVASKPAFATGDFFTASFTVSDTEIVHGVTPATVIINVTVSLYTSLVPGK